MSVISNGKQEYKPAKGFRYQTVIRVLHCQTYDKAGRCRGCGKPWPCPTYLRSEGLK